MWGGTDEAESIATIGAAFEHGINLIDTAPAYGFGRSEEIVGKAVAENGLRRSEVVIATKVGLQWESGKVSRNTSRARIMREVEDSLRPASNRLHRYLSGPFARSVGDDRRNRRSDVRVIGAGEDPRHRSEQLLGSSDGTVAPLHVLLPPYNLFERGIETDLLPYCRENKIAMLGYGALCRGLLAGRMRADTVFDGDDLRRSDPKFIRPRFAQYLAAVEARSPRATLRQARYSFGHPMDARPGHHDGIVGRASSQSVAAGQ
jgi:aryl-alcohol dehydrogenase-like predicted oxidoreductase